MKAREGPARRYQSAADFARDATLLERRADRGPASDTGRHSAAKWSRHAIDRSSGRRWSMLDRTGGFRVQHVYGPGSLSRRRSSAAAEASAEDAEAGAAEADRARQGRYKNYQMARRAIRQMTARLANDSWRRFRK